MVPLGSHTQVEDLATLAALTSSLSFSLGSHAQVDVLPVIVTNTTAKHTLIYWHLYAFQKYRQRFNALFLEG